MADYEHTLTVRFAECDAQGVVFNAHYQALCDAVLDLWVRDRMGKAWQRAVGAHFSVVASSQFDYKSPARFLDELRISGVVSRWGRTSFEIRWEAFVADEDEHDDEHAAPPRLVFRGTMTHVCVDEDKKPTPVDAVFRTRMPRPKPRL
jgi:acyl-CoA thioester hydrolase